MKNLFSKYIIKEKKEDIFHSSAYGKAQSGSIMGVASTESFSKRIEKNRDRQIVQGYGDSQIMNGVRSSGPRAKQYTPPKIDLKK